MKIKFEYKMLKFNSEDYKNVEKISEIECDKVNSENVYIVNGNLDIKNIKLIQ